MSLVNPHSNSVFQLFLLLFSLSVMTDSLPPHGLQHARLPCLSLISWSLLKLMSIESVMPLNHLIFCHPFLLLSIFPSIRAFPNESTLHIRWPKYWSFSFSISPSSEYQDWFPLGFTGLISFQSKGLSIVFSNTAVQRHSAFFIVQLSHPYMTTRKTIALIRRTFIGKVMCLFFNILSRLVIAFLPRSKCLLISWLESPSTVNIICYAALKFVSIFFLFIHKILLIFTLILIIICKILHNF